MRAQRLRAHAQNNEWVPRVARRETKRQENRAVREVRGRRAVPAAVKLLLLLRLLTPPPLSPLPGACVLGGSAAMALCSFAFDGLQQGADEDGGRGRQGAEGAGENDQWITT